VYHQRFGLARNPFNLTPDPSFLYMTPDHREALAGLLYGVMKRKGFLVLTGDAGTGKSTLLSKMTHSLAEDLFQTSIVINPTVTAPEFLEMVMLDFGIQDVPHSKAQRIAKIHSFLLNGRTAGKTSVLIVDEAHKLSLEVFEEIRLLGNFERSDEKLLQIILAGQNELDETLQREDLRQCKQRIAMWFSIHALSALQVEQYMTHRWAKAGGILPIPFSLDALAAIRTGSRGIPRVINAICDNSLMCAFGEGARSVTVEHVHAAMTDLRLDGQPKLAVVSAAETVPAVPSVASPRILPTLERYDPGSSKPSFLMRWIGKLGRVQRAESYE